MRKPVVLLSLLMACLLLPTSFSQPNGLDAAAVNDGCGCHGEQEWSVGIATDDSDLEDDWFPGITYEMRFRATEEAGPPNEPSAMIHVMVDVGEFDIDNLAVDHIMESPQHLRSDANAGSHIIHFYWIAPDTETVDNLGITNVTFTVVTMLTNDDGTPSDDPWSFANLTYEKVQSDENDDADGDQTDSTQGDDADSEGVGQGIDFVNLMQDAEDRFGVGSICYNWVYWNANAVDKSLPGWGCPAYEGAASSTDDGPTFFNTLAEAIFDGGLGGVLVVGLTGLLLAYGSKEWLEQFLETDQTVLAARNSFPHMLYAVFFAVGALYALYVPFWLAILSIMGEAWGEGNEIWFLFFEVRLRSFFSYLSVFIASLCTLYGCIMAALMQREISKLHFEARLALLGQSPQQTIVIEAVEDESVEDIEHEEEDLDDEPATFEEILAAMDAQLKEAIEESYRLRTELEDTKSKVVFLEKEVEEKDTFIEQIKESKNELSQTIESQHEEAGGKKLSLTDSVLVGDSVMGGMKIDKQINNDPQAIARAVIEAYREGLNDQD